MWSQVASGTFAELQAQNIDLALYADPQAASTATDTATEVDGTDSILHSDEVCASVMHASQSNDASSIQVRWEYIIMTAPKAP